MLRKRWQLLTALAAAGVVITGLTVAPASAAGGLSATFTKGSDWGTGYDARYTVANGSATSISAWTVEFDLPAGQTLGSAWDGAYTSNGQHVTVKNTWNGTVAPGSVVSFGFTVKYSGGFAEPTGCLLNGASCTAGSTPPPPTSTPPTTTPPTSTTPPKPGIRSAAPYLYLGWGNPPSPATVMAATGIKAFTMAFVLSSGGCAPAWDGNRPLTGGVDANAIAEIQQAGGQVVPSFGGWQGTKLGPNCADSAALAGAYQQVINAFHLDAIDIDIENSDEFENPAVQDRILGALKLVKAANPGLRTIVTFGTTTSGPNYFGTRLIEQSKALDTGIDVFTIMPFDFGGGADMYASTVSAANGLKDKLTSTFGWSDTTAYQHVGISGMNGLSDQQEQTSLADWTRITTWAGQHGLGRLAFWSVNRDHGCPGGGTVSNCSGIAQSDWDFTKVTAGF